MACQSVDSLRKITEILCVAFLLDIFSVSSAAAQSQNVDADSLFQQGRRLLQAGRLEEACASFERSQLLDATISTLINLAGCREKSGKIATAWRLFSEAARQTESSDNAQMRQLHSIASSRAARLAPRVSTITILVPAYAEDIEIVCDEEIVEKERWSKPIALDGGLHQIHIRGRSIKEWSTRVTLQIEFDRQNVAVPHDLSAVLPFTQTNIGVASLHHDATMHYSRRWDAWKPWVAVAAAGSSLVVGAILHKRSYDHFNEGDKEFEMLACWQERGTCRSEDLEGGVKSKWSLAKREQAYAIGGYAIGGALAISSIVLLYINRPRPLQNSSAFIEMEVSGDAKIFSVGTAFQ